jgi:hypothetical protein
MGRGEGGREGEEREGEMGRGEGGREGEEREGERRRRGRERERNDEGVIKCKELAEKIIIYERGREEVVSEREREFVEN